MRAGFRAADSASTDVRSAEALRSTAICARSPVIPQYGTSGSSPDARYLANSLTVVQLASMTKRTIAAVGRPLRCACGSTGGSIARTPRHTSTTKSAYVVTRIETEGPHHGVVAEEPGESVVERMEAPAARDECTSTSSGHNHGQVASTMIDNNTATTTVFISRPSTLCTLTIRRIELVTTVVSVVPNVAEQPIAR
jgi:hypothetical protein